ncbi:hypothetical protein HPB51_018877 [Rhipicephalus microplus]|uniref:Uncharacterized protein n=1 Tax=Rhipicephalus microplus TaxID=6941 RepID=A0A9J6D6A6_RHIMP|nr:hypothetical protein HPB51_018877 [Rhipicephalus microplus]
MTASSTQDDSEPECEPCSSTSSSCYESAVEEQPEEAKHRIKDASCQTPLSCYSRGVQAVQNTSHADTQTDESHACRCVKAKSTQQSRDAEVKKLRERLKNIRQNQGREIQQLRLKIKQLLAKPQAATPQYGASNRTTSRERKPVEKNRPDDHVSPPQPRPPLRQKNLPARPTPGKQADDASGRTKIPAIETGGQAVLEVGNAAACARSSRSARL